MEQPEYYLHKAARAEAKAARALTPALVQSWLERASDYRAMAEGAIQAAERAMASLEHSDPND